MTVFSLAFCLQHKMRTVHCKASWLEKVERMGAGHRRQDSVWRCFLSSLHLLLTADSDVREHKM